jgi:hypothetical protein
MVQSNSDLTPSAPIPPAKKAAVFFVAVLALLVLGAGLFFRDCDFKNKSQLSLFIDKVGISNISNIQYENKIGLPKIYNQFITETQDIIGKKEGSLNATEKVFADPLFLDENVKKFVYSNSYVKGGRKRKQNRNKTKKINKKMKK